PSLPCRRQRPVSRQKPATPGWRQVAEDYSISLALITSPPLLVINFRMASTAMPDLRRRTEPSAKAARTPFLVIPPSLGRGILGSSFLFVGPSQGSSSLNCV